MKYRTSGRWHWLRRIFQPRLAYGTTTVPEGWSDVTDEVVMKVAALVAAQWPEERIRKLEVLRLLIKIPDNLWRLLSPEVVSDLLQEVAWAWHTPPQFTEAGKFEWANKVYWLPRTLLVDMTAGEFAAAETSLKLFTSGNPPALQALVATICRPRVQGDPETLPEREPYIQSVSEGRAQRMRNLNLGIRMAVFLWFCSQIRELQKTYPSIWPNQVDERGSIVQSPLASLGFHKVLLELAETPVFGDFEKVCQTPLHTVLTYLTVKVVEDRERQATEAARRASR